MSVTDPSDAVNAGMAKQTEGRRLTLSHKSPPSVNSLVGWLVGWLVDWLPLTLWPLHSSFLFFQRLNSVFSTRPPVFPGVHFVAF